MRADTKGVKALLIAIFIAVILAVFLSHMTEALYERKEAAAEASETYEPIILTMEDIETLAYVTMLPEETPMEKVATTTYYDVPLSEDVQDAIYQYAEEYGLSPALVLAVIDVESNFDADAISYTGDYGLMQVNVINTEGLEAEFGIRDLDLLDPIQNIRSGCYLLNIFIQSSGGDVVKGLMSYNMGITAAANKWNQGVTSTAYTDKVLTALEKYQ